MSGDISIGMAIEIWSLAIGCAIDQSQIAHPITKSSIANHPPNRPIAYHPLSNAAVSLDSKQKTIVQLARAVAEVIHPHAELVEQRRVQIRQRRVFRESNGPAALER